ncbi:translation initiation factor IF-2 subunit gamma [Candidatus Pacearchaeota archaeon]|nr:translation initiation factor IF-2 subunit gamma [Candidatus Pacearchaeota archaeon]
MTKDNNIDITKLPILNVGMAGHIDHGKTTLLYALSGKFTDTHSEELKRGITIKLGYSDIILRKNKNGSEYGVNEKDGEPYRYITFVDVPGHEMLMATMLSGAAIVDIALLVVAANEGIKPQTREHLVALQAKNVKKIIILQNKIDLVSKEQAIKNYNEIKEFVKGTIAENSPIIPVSAQQKINIDKVYKILAEAEIPLREVKSEPVFIIARSFDINKPGTSASELHGGVLGGSLMKGILKVGDEIEIKPGLNVIEKNQKIYETVKTRIVSLQRGEHKVKEAGPGGSLAIETELDMTLTKADNLSGCVAGLNGKLPDISHNIKIKAQHFKEVLGMEEHVDVEDFKPSEMLMLSVNTSISVGRVKTVKDGILDLELNIPIVPFKEDNVGIARNIKGHWRLIGFGEMI